METKKVRKKRFNLLKFLVVMLFLYIVFSAFFELAKSPIKNIVVLNNNYLSDELIIETAKLEKYPSFIKTSSSSICKRLDKLELVEECSVKKKFGYIVEIDIKEHKILYKMRSTNKYILSGDVSFDSKEVYKGVPVLINYISDEILSEMNKEYSELSLDIINKISEIEYSPTDYDKERFILYMNDKNMVYITLKKIENLNKYDEIKKKLEGHVGILYLDSGNYFEIKE